MSFRTTDRPHHRRVLLSSASSCTGPQLRRNPDEKPPENLTPFLDDEDLEGRSSSGARLVADLRDDRRPRAAALLLLEPGRQTDAAEFDERAVERGATLFANVRWRRTTRRSRCCAPNCHGVDAGAVRAVRAPARNRRRPKQKNNDLTCPSASRSGGVGGARAQHRAAALRRAQVIQIITYGRPGTPMPAVGRRAAAARTPGRSTTSSPTCRASRSRRRRRRSRRRPARRCSRPRRRRRSTKRRRRRRGTRPAKDLARRQTPKATADVQPLQVDGRAQSRDLERSRGERARSQRSRGRAALPHELRPLPHQGLVVLRPGQPLIPQPAPAGSGASARPAATARARAVPGSPGDDATTPGFQKQYEWVADRRRPAQGLRRARHLVRAHAALRQMLTKDQINAIIAYERNL